MKIYVNARFLLQRPTGVERYAYEICKALVAVGAKIILVCPTGGKINEAYDINDFNIIRFGKGRSHIWEQLVFPFFFIGKRDFVVLSFTGLGSILLSNKVMTVHDLSFLENPSWFSRTYYYYYKLMTPLAIRTSKHILTVSEFSKKEIQRFYRFVNSDKITVVYNAADKQKFHVTTTAKTEHDAQPYFLAVSSLDKRKNFENLLEAFKDIEHCKLKIVGGANRVFSRSTTPAVKSENIEFLGRVSDTELLRLYNHAYAFIFPSLYEGFGLPLVEAMACGCPVLTSDIEVLREVCGEAALYFDPHSHQNIRTIIEEFLKTTADERQLLINKGLQNCKRFSWQSSATKLLLTLNKLKA